MLLRIKSFSWTKSYSTHQLFKENFSCPVERPNQTFSRPAHKAISWIINQLISCQDQAPRYKPKPLYQSAAFADMVMYYSTTTISQLTYSWVFLYGQSSSINTRCCTIFKLLITADSREPKGTLKFTSAHEENPPKSSVSKPWAVSMTINY